MLREFNRFFVDLIEECEKLGQCVDHHGFQDRRVSVQISNQHLILEVQSNTRNTPSSRNFGKILCAIRNHFLSLLNKILDNDHIPSGLQMEDFCEELRVMYYKDKKRWTLSNRKVWILTERTTVKFPKVGHTVPELRQKNCPRTCPAVWWVPSTNSPSAKSYLFTRPRPCHGKVPSDTFPRKCVMGILMYCTKFDEMSKKWSPLNVF